MVPLQGTETGLQARRDCEVVCTHARGKRKALAGRISTLQRSRALLEADGYHVEVVEQNIRTGKTSFKRDLWNFADILAIRRGEVLAVQTTTGSNMAARITKIVDSPLLPRVREAGIRVVVHGWTARVVKRGEAAREWVCRTEDLS